MLSVVTVLAVAGCASGAGAVLGDEPQDTAGLTQAEAAGLSLEEEFGLASERYVEMQGVLEEAQLQISNGAWFWNGGDVLPVAAGADAFGEPLPGADDDNSYFFTAGRILEPEGAEGARSDLDPMIEYFDQKGWESGSREIGRNFEARADSGDGWWVTYTVRPNGQYSLAVYSEPFWTNDSGALFSAIADRDPADFPEESVPGEYPPFPSWSDPVQP
ncbi:hypothetical protein [Frigoribacterium sp. Leaf172]|uniref:hypothetical protein n=1 Tax=Frigoribacterium sp. Leaf172 TaxID=1736285 RepID=UPI000A87B9B6|nr:hypothetical protein [Frigoribacterium sp. Leaf172]